MYAPSNMRNLIIQLSCKLTLLLLFFATLTTHASVVCIIPKANLKASHKDEKVLFETLQIIQADLNSINGIEWVERAELAPIMDEIGLSISGLIPHNKAIQLGKWAKADIAITAQLNNHFIHIEAIDLLTAEILASSEIPTTLAPSRPLKATEEFIEHFGNALTTTTKKAVAKLEQSVDTIRLAPLFFKNIGQRDRIQFFETEIFNALYKKTEETDGLHANRFSRKKQSTAETELAILGLTSESNDFSNKIADYYLWGEFEEKPSGQGTSFENTPIVLHFLLWDGLNAPQKLSWSGTVGTRESGYQQLLKRIVQIVSQTTDQAKFSNEALLNVSTSLEKRAEELEKEYLKNRGEEFLKSNHGKNLYKYTLLQLELASFFAPEKKAIWEKRIRLKYSEKNPAKLTSSLEGLWEQAIDWTYLSRRDSIEPTSQKLREASEFIKLKKYVELVNAFGAGKTPPLSLQDSWSRQIEAFQEYKNELIPFLEKQDKGGSNHAILVTFEELVEPLYTHFSPVDADYLFEFSKKIEPLKIFKHVDPQDLLHLYNLYGKGHEVIERFSGYKIESLEKELKNFHRKTANTSSTKEKQNTIQFPRPANRTKPPIVSPTIDKVWKTNNSDSSQSPFPSLKPSLKGKILVQHWPLEFFGRQTSYREPLRDLSINNDRKIHDIQHEFGKIWISESTVRPWPSTTEKKWREQQKINAQGNHYLTIFDPATRETMLVSQFLGNHSIINRIFRNNDEIWLATDQDGIFVINQEGKLISKHNTSNGLLSNSVKTLLHYDGSIIALTTDQEHLFLNEYNLETQKWLSMDSPQTEVLNPYYQKWEKYQPSQADKMKITSSGSSLLIQNNNALYYLKNRGSKWQELLEFSPSIKSADIGAVNDIIAYKDNYLISGSEGLIEISPERKEATWKLHGRVNSVRHFENQLIVSIYQASNKRGAQNQQPIEDSHLLFFDNLEKTPLIRYVIPELRVNKFVLDRNFIWMGGSHQFAQLYKLPIDSPSDSSTHFKYSNSIHHAAYFADTEKLKQFIKNGVDPNQKSNRDWTPLLAAIESKNIGAMKILLENAAHTEAFPSSGEHPLLLAVQSNSLPTVEYLLKLGIDINETGAPIPPILQWQLIDQVHSPEKFREHIEEKNVPKPPSNLQATWTRDQKLRLTWKDNSDNESFFVVYADKGDYTKGDFKDNYSVGGERSFRGRICLPPGTTSLEYENLYKLNSAKRPNWRYIDMRGKAFAMDPGETYSFFVHAVNGVTLEHSSQYRGPNTSNLVTVKIPLDLTLKESAHLQDTNLLDGNYPRPHFRFGNTALHGAIALGNEALLNFLLNQQPNIQRLNYLNESPILIAAKHLNWNCCEHLMSLGTDLEQMDIFNNTLISIVLRQDQHTIFRKILDHGIDPWERHPKDNYSGNAFRYLPDEDIIYALKNGVNPNGVAVHKTLMSHVFRSRSDRLIQAFIDHGFDLNYRKFDRSGLYVLTNDLHEIVESVLWRGDVKWVQWLLDQGVDINGRYGAYKHMTMLMMAAEHHDITMIEFLLSKKANIKAVARQRTAASYTKDPYLRSLLSPETISSTPKIEDTQSSILNQLIKNKERRGYILKNYYIGPKLKTDRIYLHEISISDNEAKLLEAAKEGNMTELKKLVKEKTDINVLDKKSLSPLFYAIINNHKEFAIHLINLGAEINLVNNRGFPPIAFAVELGQKEVVKSLLEAGANPNLVRDSAVTPLNTVQSEDMFQLLIKNGARTDVFSPKQLNMNYKNALIVAASRGYLSSVKELLGKNVDVNAHTNWIQASYAFLEGVTLPEDDIDQIVWSTSGNAFCWAAAGGHVEILKLLKEAGANIYHSEETTEERNGKNNALMWAIYQGQTEAVKYLLSIGLRSPDAKSVAEQRGYRKISKLLEAVE